MTTNIELTTELRQGYIDVIHHIWPSLGGYTASNVSEDVVKKMDFVLNEIADCSKSFGAVNAIYKAFYAPFTMTKWPSLIKKSVGTLIKWLKGVKSDIRYRACINTAAAKWRSDIEMTLMGI